jgi:outer membrane immunogenic protein
MVSALGLGIGAFAPGHAVGSQRLDAEEFEVKKLAIALTAIAAFTAPALAADMARAPVRAAAPVAYAPSWTGCYVGGGGGYGLWNQENTGFIDGPPRVQFTSTTTAGGRGYFGTVQGGCDYQFPVGASNFVVGAFGDYDWSSLKGHLNPAAAIGLVGDEKMSSAWAAGGRIGWLAFPSLLTYFSAGYTQATFDRTNLSVAFGPPFFPLGLPTSAFIDKKTYKGWFIGAGDEYAISFLPGLFWKTEYRFSEFDRETNPVRFPSGAPSGVSDDSRKFVHTIRSELVYRFN